MTTTVLLLAMAGFLVLMFAWGFRCLQTERFQFLCTVPAAKQADGSWSGLNLTYYGVFNAVACVLAVTVLYTLMGSVSISPGGTTLVVAPILFLCLPASRIIARWVEGKRFTFSIGGAAFVGILATPGLVLIIHWLFDSWSESTMPVITVLAASAIAYAFGEGVGRLACVSFGCCYGKPLSSFSPRVRRILTPFSFTFTGETKKIAYASHLDGEKIFPIQGFTSVICCTAGMAGTVLFMAGMHRTAFILALTVTQLWRFVSEFLRADYRGGFKISAYQIMSLISVAYSVVILFFFQSPPAEVVDLVRGARMLWSPGMILTLQGLWLITFYRTGRSDVTGSTVSFHVREDRI